MDAGFSTHHRFMFGDALNLSALADGSVECVVTSPPYPMIGMWDEGFSEQDPNIGHALETGKGQRAFALMHNLLDRAWQEVERVLVPGGFACINIGDATRSMAGQFALYPNHSRIQQAFGALGMNSLPTVLWRKPTNSPTKFMGSGMLPSGAYVTLEHEYILVFRKGGKRTFTTPERRACRNRSAFFWEERNRWFTDLWDLPGISQGLTNGDGRRRSAAFPLEIPSRLIRMYSVQGDTVLDPFVGTGTTSVAALMAGRNSIGVEIEPELEPVIRESFSNGLVGKLNALTEQRLSNHRDFVTAYREKKGPEALKYDHPEYGFPVMTKQEIALQFPRIDRLEWDDSLLVAAEHSF